MSLIIKITENMFLSNSNLLKFILIE